jgi:hypothetical protein
MFLNLYTKVLGKAKQESKVAVWGMSPGYTATGMTRFQGTKTPEQAIDTILYLLDQPFSEHTQGLYFADRQLEPVFEFE